MGWVLGAVLGVVFNGLCVWNTWLLAKRKREKRAARMEREMYVRNERTDPDDRGR